MCGFTTPPLWHKLLLAASIVPVLAGLSAAARPALIRGQAAPAATPPSIAHCLPGPGLPPVVACTGGGAIPYPAGWNLVAGYDGVYVFRADGPLYTLQAGDSDYEAVPSESGEGLTWTPLKSGVGYWAYFSQPEAVPFPPGPHRLTFSVTVPAGQFVMVGNPFPTGATVTGADVVYSYDPDQGYKQTTFISTGHGAWVYSAGGGTITLSST